MIIKCFPDLKSHGKGKKYLPRDPKLAKLAGTVSRSLDSGNFLAGTGPGGDLTDTAQSQLKKA